MENPDARQEVISIQNLWAGYEHDVVLEDVNLSVRELDFMGLIGPNGGGKTTLLKVLLGLLPPIRGTVRIMGQSVRKGTQAHRLRAPGGAVRPRLSHQRVGRGAHGPAGQTPPAAALHGRGR